MSGERVPVRLHQISTDNVSDEQNVIKGKVLGIYLCFSDDPSLI
jgi:hypothetical protein